MRRDMDLVRNLLLNIENASDRNIVRRQKSVFVDGFSEAVILDHVNLLQDAGLLVPFRNQFGTTQDDSLSVSWKGYEFIDSIRDDEIWRRTKDTARSAGGFAVSTLMEIAKALVKQKSAELLGMEIA